MKNEQLKRGRGISFEEMILLMNEGHLIDEVEHPNLPQPTSNTEISGKGRNKK